jgi:hypothetical protein
LNVKVVAASVFVGTVFFLPVIEPASAEVEYPWCRIAGGRDGSLSCGFVSHAQCMQVRIGTDMCVQNPRYPGPPAASPHQRRPGLRAPQ